MKQRWTTKAKCIRNMLIAAKVRGDKDSEIRLQSMLDKELKANQ